MGIYIIQKEVYHLAMEIEHILISQEFDIHLNWVIVLDVQLDRVEHVFIKVDITFGVR